MSANTIVDLGNTCLFNPSITVTATAVVSGTAVGVSGAAVVGQWLDMSNSDTFCNVFINVGPCSGPLGIQVQTAPGANVVPPFTNAFSGNIFSGAGPQSGQFTDPTSGLAQLPTWMSSGGIFWVNSGLYAAAGGQNASGAPLTNGYPTGSLPFGPNPVVNAMGGQAILLSGSWPEMCSGGVAYGAFQRNNQYVRLVLLSGATQVNFIQAGFIANQMTTGSGGGATWQPIQAGTAVYV